METKTHYFNSTGDAYDACQCDVTRKDYIAIAQAIKAVRDTLETYSFGHAVLNVLSQDIAALMAADNPAFDRARFLKACGVQS